MLKKLLKEPFLHFLVLGGFISYIYTLTNQNSTQENSIVISQPRVNQLISNWKKKFFREPTEEEKEELIQNEIYQEIMYKEALTLGLDKNDAIIKRRLAQKMEFVSFDRIALEPPRDEELKSFMLKHKEKYSYPLRVSFTQEVLGTQQKLFKPLYSNMTEFDISRHFGRAFAKELFALDMDKKPHKLHSAYARHQVTILSKDAPKMKSFQEIKSIVKKDFLESMNEKLNQEIYKAMKAEYSIQVGDK